MSNFSIDREENYTVVASEVDKLNGLVAPSLKAELSALNASGVSNIILNLSNTRYCDSSGLSAILVGNRLCKNSNGTFVLTGLSPMVAKLIAISQLENILNICPTEGEAIQLVMLEEVERDMHEEGTNGEGEA